mgnify:CR=1 FL=1
MNPNNFNGSADFSVDVILLLSLLLKILVAGVTLKLLTSDLKLVDEWQQKVIKQSKSSMTLVSFRFDEAYNLQR